MAMARREFAAVLRSIKKWLELVVAALLIVMDSFDEASRTLEEQPQRRSLFKNSAAVPDGSKFLAMNVTERGHKEMERRCHSNAI